VAASPEPSTIVPTSAGSLPRVVVLDRGAEPRSALRYRYVSGHDATMDMRMTMAAGFSVDGAPVPSTIIPAMHFVAAVQLGEVTPAGSVRYDFQYRTAEVVKPSDANAATVEQMNASLGGLVGVTGWATVDDRGRAIDGGFISTDDLDPTTQAILADIQRSVAQQSAPLPEEPVGAGARWMLEQHVATSGLVVDQSATYRLDAIDDAGLHLSLDLAQTAAPGPIEQPGAPDGTSATLLELTSHGSARMTMALVGIIPASEMTITSHNVIQVTDRQVATDVTIEFTIGAGPSGGAAASGAPAATGTPATTGVLPRRVIRARHILVSPNDDPGGAAYLDPSDPAWGLARVEAIRLAINLRAMADPTSRRSEFEARAEAQSDDLGSGARGGDLGAFPRDVMVPEFADALFDAVDPQPGDIIGPVRTEFGWHVLMYEGEGDGSD